MFVYLKLYIYLILWTIPLIWKQLHKFDIDSNIRQNSNSKCYISTNIASAMAHIVNKHITLGINVEQITRYNQKKLPRVVNSFWKRSLKDLFCFVFQSFLTFSKQITIVYENSRFKKTITLEKRLFLKKKNYWQLC